MVGGHRVKAGGTGSLDRHHAGPAHCARLRGGPEPGAEGGPAGLRPLIPFSLQLSGVEDMLLEQLPCTE